MTCEHKNIKTLHEETGNRICLDCKKHWYIGKEYTRKEWDALMEIGEVDKIRTSLLG